MAQNDDKLKKGPPNENDELKPDPETLHTPDPQEEMRGPFSSAVKKMEKSFDSKETKKEANEKRDKHM